nr:hypothetical protein CFP56_29557 [Quercus suber]
MGLVLLAHKKLIVEKLEAEQKVKGEAKKEKHLVAEKGLSASRGIKKKQPKAQDKRASFPPSLKLHQMKSSPELNMLSHSPQNTQNNNNANKDNSAIWASILRARDLVVNSGVKGSLEAYIPSFAAR